MEAHTDPLATAMFAGTKEQYLLSAVIDRGSMRSWLDAGGPDAFARAKMRTRQLLAAYHGQPFLYLWCTFNDAVIIINVTCRLGLICDAPVGKEGDAVILGNKACF